MIHDLPTPQLFPNTTLFRSQSTLGSRDQVDDLRRIGCDHAGPRRLLRAVVEIEANVPVRGQIEAERRERDRKSTRLNSSHGYISYAVFCLKYKNNVDDTDLT